MTGLGPGSRADARPVPPPRDPVVIDGGDRACVRLLLEPRARISGLSAGTVIHLIASDPAASLDLPAWCHLTGHAYLGPVPAARPGYAMRTAPAPAATDPASPWRRRPGGAAGHAGSKPGIVTQVTEHPAVLACCKALERWHGAQVTLLPVDRSGLVERGQWPRP